MQTTPSSLRAAAWNSLPALPSWARRTLPALLTPKEAVALAMLALSFYWFCSLYVETGLVLGGLIPPASLYGRHWLAVMNAAGIGFGIFYGALGARLYAISRERLASARGNPPGAAAVSIPASE